MSESERRHVHQCVSCGINITGTSTVTFKCPDCDQEISYCSKYREQNNLYECPNCGFTGPQSWEE